MGRFLLEMSDDGSSRSLKRERRRRRSIFRRFSRWEVLLFGILVLVLLFCFPRPIYETWAKFRASRKLKKVERLAQSQKERDWARLHELAYFTATNDLPGFALLYINPDSAKMKRYGTPVRSAAAKALERMVYSDASNILKALQSKKENLRRQTHQALSGYLFHSDSWASQGLRTLAAACLDGDAAVRKYVLEVPPFPSQGSSGVWAAVHVSEVQLVQCRVVSQATTMDARRAAPFVAEFLDNVSRLKGQYLAVNELRSLLAWYVANTADEDWPDVERLLQAVAKRYSLYVTLKSIPAFLDRGGPKARDIVADMIASASGWSLDWAFRENPEMVGLTDVWLRILDNPDAGMRILGARVLGYNKARETADALAKLLEDPVVEVRVQAAWSLATMGDGRGRQALSTLAEDDTTTCTAPYSHLAELWGAMGPVRLPGWNTPTGSPANASGLPVYPAKTVARDILKHVDEGGTMPLPISAWPRESERTPKPARNDTRP